MKNFIRSFRLTLVFCVFFSVFYILVLWLFAQFAGPNSGNAEVATLDGKVVGAANVGQSFTEDIYFWGRPSCAGEGYDATSSSGSNKGPPVWTLILLRHVPTYRCNGWQRLVE